MKKIKNLLLATIAATALPLSAAEYVFVPANDDIETKLCISAAENKLHKFKRQAGLVSHTHTVYRTIAENIQCNDKSIADFAFQYDADKTLKFLDKYRNHDIEIRREISALKESKNLNDADSDKIVYITVE